MSSSAPSSYVPSSMLATKFHTHTKQQAKLESCKSQFLNFWIANWKIKAPSSISSIIIKPISAPGLTSAVTCFSSRSLVFWPRTFHVRLTVTQVAEGHFLSQYSYIARPWQYHSTSTRHSHSIPIHPMQSTHWQQRLFKKLNGASRPHPSQPLPQIMIIWSIRTCPFVADNDLWLKIRDNQLT
jgi:hypothetical protein